MKGPQVNINTTRAKHWQSSHENHQTIDMVHRMSALQHAPACPSLHSDGGRGGVICGVACCQNSSEELHGKLVRRSGLGNLLGSVRGSIRTLMSNVQSYHYAEDSLRRWDGAMMARVRHGSRRKDIGDRQDDADEPVDCGGFDARTRVETSHTMRALSLGLKHCFGGVDLEKRLMQTFVNLGHCLSLNGYRADSMAKISALAQPRCIVYLVDRKRKHKHF